MGLIGLVLLIPARPIFELFALSRQYAAATTDAARSQLLAAGDALLALFDGTNWFMNTLLGALSLLTSSLLMLRSQTCSKATAYAGIFTNVMVCGFFIPTLGKFLLFLSLSGYIPRAGTNRVSLSCPQHEHPERSSIFSLRSRRMRPSVPSNPHPSTAWREQHRHSAQDAPLSKNAISSRSQYMIWYFLLAKRFLQMGRES